MNNETHHWPKGRCYYCGEPAVARCDGVNSFLVDGKGIILTDHPDVTDYCNRALCDEHATCVGMSTASGHVDSIDWCPKHMTKHKLGEGPELKIKSV